jgi:glycine betaine/proline transport system permease protein
LFKVTSIIDVLTTQIPLGNWIETFVNFIMTNFSGPLDSFSNLIGSMIGSFEVILSFSHPIFLIAIFALLAWRLKSFKLSIFVSLGLLFVLNLRMWDPLITTLSSIITSVFVALIIGIPVGILKAHNKIVHYVTRPILDFMQTIPPFVYLIPALMFFGLGNVSGVIATVVFAIAPPIRLTYLGIKQVPEELKEAGHAFGVNWWQMLFKIELPGAMPSIMMGINQCIMLALSMVVISAMIGAGGLGKPVLRSLSVVDVGLGFEAGLGVVILAMVLDRIFGRDE